MNLEELQYYVGEGQKVTFEPMTEYVVGKCVVVRILDVHVLSPETTLCRSHMHAHAHDMHMHLLLGRDQGY